MSEKHGIIVQDNTDDGELAAEPIISDDDISGQLTELLSLLTGMIELARDRNVAREAGAAGAWAEALTDVLERVERIRRNAEERMGNHE
jgi:hypothetical protein